MKKRNILALAAAAVLLLAALCGCGAQADPAPESSTPAPRTPVKVSAIAGPTGIGLVDLMDKNDAGKSANDYTVTIVTDPQQAVAAIVNGSADIAAVPTNLASALYKKTEGKVQVLAVNTLGVLHILENGDTIKSVTDLKGKTIYSTGKAANPEYVLRFVLEKNGIDPDKDVKLEFVEDNDTLGTLLTNGTADVAMVPQPKATACMAASETVRSALDMTAEWKKVAGGESELMMGCVVARTAFVQENAAAVKAFLTEYEASIKAVNADPAAAGTLCERYQIIPKAAIAQKAIPACNLTFVAGAQMKTQLSGYLNVLFGYSPAAVGSALPDDAFYYAG